MAHATFSGCHHHHRFFFKLLLILFILGSMLV